MGGLSATIINLYRMLSSNKAFNVELLIIEQIEIPTNDYPFKSFNNKRKNKFEPLNKIGKYVRLKKYIKTSNFDVIIDQRYRINPISEFFFVKYLYRNKKVIYTIHSSILSDYLPKSQLLTRYLFGNAFKLVCCSNGIARLVKEKYGLINVKVIYNGLNLSDFDFSYKKPFDFKYIIAVGRFHKVKQFDKLIEVYSRSNLPKLNIKLVLVGDGEELDNYKKLCESLNIIANVVFTGAVPNPSHYISNAMLLIMCSTHEGFPMVILESLACETPVISFDLETGPSEIIEPKINGILVENQNFEELLQNLNEACTNIELFKNQEKKAKQIISKFSNEYIMNDWLKLLKDE